MMLRALKNMWEKASEKVLRAVIKDLEKCCGKNMGTEELVNWQRKDLKKCINDRQHGVCKLSHECSTIVYTVPPKNKKSKRTSFFVGANGLNGIRCRGTACPNLCLSQLTLT